MRRSWMPLFAAAFAVAIVDPPVAARPTPTQAGRDVRPQLRRELEAGRASGVRQARAWTFDRRAAVAFDGPAAR